MPCPVASVLLLSMIFGGIWTLLMQDRARGVSRGVLFALIVAWIGYYLWVRTPTARIVLEVLSVGAWLVGMWRVYRLMRYEHVVPPFTRSLSRMYELLKPIISNRWVFGVKAWLLFMIIADLARWADFSWLSYLLVSLLLIGVGLWVGLRTNGKLATERTTG